MTGMTALIGFAGWTLLLMVITVSWRSIEIARGKPANSWTRGQPAPVPDVFKRADHAHMNCVENLPLFAVIVFAAALLDKSAVVDAVAVWVLLARIGQSLAHLAGISHGLVLVRASFFGVQIVLFAYLLWSLAV